MANSLEFHAEKARAAAKFRQPTRTSPLLRDADTGSTA
jgi:hypothetical protein